MQQARFDKTIILEEGEELTGVVVQRPSGIKIYSVKEMGMEDILGLVNKK